MSKINLNLPPVIKVRIVRNASGVGYYAELPEFGVFTEANSRLELDDMVNDLIYELFDIPRSIQKKIRYFLSDGDKLPKNVGSLLMMGTRDVFEKNGYVS